VVVNTDVAATVLAYFGLPAPADTVGRAMVVVPVKGSPEQALSRDLIRHDALEVGRRQVFRAFCTVASIALWLCALLLLLGGRAPRWVRLLVRGLLLAVLCTPLASLLVAAFPGLGSSALIVAAVIVMAMLLALLGSLLTRGRRGEVVAAAGVVVVLAGDLLTGQHLLQWATLSYSVSAAARYYGIGNEYGGAMLGAGLIAAAALLGRGRWRRAVTTAALLGLAALVGWPRFGANLGMALGCAAGFAAFAMYLWREHPSWRDAAVVALVVLGLGAAVIAMDALATRSSESSHLGLLVATIRAQGWTPLLDVAVRKLSMNWMLLRASMWTNMSLAALTVFGVAIAVQPRGVMEAAQSSRVIPALLACAVGTITSLLANDSGIVAAGMALCYAAGALAYLGLRDAPAEVARERPAEPQMAQIRAE
jgi:hypothetical protein